MRGGLVHVRALLNLDNKAYFPFDLPDWPLVPEAGFQSVSPGLLKSGIRHILGLFRGSARSVRSEVS